METQENDPKPRTTEEAMVRLRSKHADKIDAGRDIAIRIATETGSVTSRDVFATMAAAGIIKEKDSCRWLGSIFNNCRLFRKAGKVSYSESERNIHEREVTVWTLA